MRLMIDHRTRYEFSEPQARVVQLLRMTPADHAGQTVTDWSIGVDCDARLRDGRDGYGNVTSMLYVDGPVRSIEIVVTGEVMTEENGGMVLGVAETLPPLFFLRATALTGITPGIASLVQSLAGVSSTPLDQATGLTATVCERIANYPARSPKSRTAEETLAESWGSMRDKAHLLSAAARAAGLPARFVSGHYLGGPDVGGHKSAHCWVEIHVEGLGWISFDPSTGGRTGESHVRVAIGLDASDATPLSGTRTGGGIEALDVAVRVARSDAFLQQ